MDPVATDAVGTEATAPAAAFHVVAAQGAVAAANRAVHVSWDRAVADAVAHVVMRDGERIGQVDIEGASWNDFSFVDRTASAGRTHTYQVQAVLPGGRLGRPSHPHSVFVRADADLGTGRTFRVDDYAGSDIERAEAAVRAATSAGGGVVEFGARAYRFARPLVLASTRDVVLRGQGAGLTTLEPTTPGPQGDACSSTPVEVIVVQGNRRTLPSVRLAAPVRVNARAVRVTSTAGLAVGQVILLDESKAALTPLGFAAAGVVQDPGTGTDERVPWDANRIVAIRGNTVSFAQPWSQAFTPAVTWQTMGDSAGNAIENLTVQGPSESDRGLYRLIRLDHTVDVTIANVEARWANRNLVEVKGYRVTIVGFRGAEGGAASYDGTSCKYKITVYRSAELRFLDSVMGNPDHDRNQSLLTIQKAQRVLVRGSRFYGSRTYAVNEHGSGSRFHVIENNLLAAGPTASFGAILLGNDTWGFSGPVAIRNNLLLDNSRDLAMQENSYGIRFIGNTSRNARLSVIDGYGWAGPFTSPSRYGSLRMTVADNDISGGHGAGLALGRRDGSFPHLGVSDVVVTGNRLAVAGEALAWQGPAVRVRVADNTWPGGTRLPQLDAASDWYRNGDGIERNGTARRQSWSARSFHWERYDRGAAPA